MTKSVITGSELIQYATNSHFHQSFLPELCSESA